MVRDARYDDMRSPIAPIAYLPYRALNSKGQPEPRNRAAYMVRLRGLEATAVAASLRREVSNARSEFRVSNMRTQKEIDDSHTVRERLLAMLALFFSVTAVVLAGIGLYGVLDYSVIQRRREIGIRMAIGARAANVAGRLTAEILLLVVGGAAAGVAVGIASERYIRTLLFGVKATDAPMLVLPVMVIIAVALLAAVPAIVRALRINPAVLLRAD
jgi:ABC-type antimicrobial peptide transport system permease subunit